MTSVSWSFARRTVVCFINLLLVRRGWLWCLDTRVGVVISGVPFRSEGGGGYWSTKLWRWPHDGFFRFILGPENKGWPFITSSAAVPQSPLVNPLTLRIKVVRHYPSGWGNPQLSLVHPFDLKMEVNRPYTIIGGEGSVRPEYSPFRSISSSKFILDLGVLYYTFTGAKLFF